MAKATEVERAYDRCSILSAIVRHIRDDALARPTEAVWLKLGLVEEGDKKPEAVARMERLFDELQALIEHLFVLDMTAQFERAAMSRVTNYIDRRIPHKAGLPSLATKVIKNKKDFENMIDFLRLLEDHIDTDLLEQLNMIRKARNIFAHGVDVRVLPSISREDVRDSLKDALAAM